MKKLTSFIVFLMMIFILGACSTGADFRTDVYSVIFYTDGGSYVETLRNLEAGSTIQRPENPDKPGAVFLGWYTDSSFTTPFPFETYKVTGGVTIFAKWEYRDYVIEYVLNAEDAVNHESNPTAYNSYSNTIFLRSASRPNYNFLGWFTDPTFTPSSRITTIQPSHGGDVVLYARWSAPLS